MKEIDKLEDIVEPDIRMHELCNILGISPSSIRNYEKNNAINIRREDNGYRYYFFNDVLQVLNLENLVHLGFTVKQAKEMSLKANYSNNLEMLEKQHSVIEENIKLLKIQLERLEHIQYLYQCLQDYEGKYIESEIDSYYWMECQDQTHIVNDERKDIISKWNKDYPFFITACRNKLDTLSKTQVADIGLLVFEKDKDKFEKDDLKYCEYHAKQKSIMTISKSHAEMKDYYSVIEDHLKYLEENNYKLVDDILSIVITTDTKKDDHYFDYYLQFYPISS